jgi:hypothetical protein
MSLKLKEEMNHLHLLDALIDNDDFGLTIELRTFAKNMNKEIIGVIDSLFYFLKISYI